MRAIVTQPPSRGGKWARASHRLPRRGTAPVDIPSDIDERIKLIQTDKNVHVHVSGETPFRRRLHLDLDLAMGISIIFAVVEPIGVNAVYDRHVDHHAQRHTRGRHEQRHRRVATLVRQTPVIRRQASHAADVARRDWNVCETRGVVHHLGSADDGRGGGGCGGDAGGVVDGVPTHVVRGAVSRHPRGYERTEGERDEHREGCERASEDGEDARRERRVGRE